MYNMRAEHLATGNGPDLLWHVLHRDGRTLCGRQLNGKETVTEGVLEREDYCRRCMNSVAAVVGAGLVGASADAQEAQRA
ncbi:hypothetical protein OG906_34520 (plasmid) [Streptomyces sp. NBC_01426]|uniref:hypothetical protein n=1 Tax=Streptomyces sp. NBC_01426 TaxID=2975866 RepID=UPI002E31F19C|nr:hypothetical protein [Streptomyces sp. NBC_01426]